MTFKVFTNSRFAFWGGFILAIPLGFVLNRIFEATIAQGNKPKIATVSEADAILDKISTINQKLQKYENFYPVGNFEGYGYEFNVLPPNKLEVTFARRQYKNYEIIEHEVIKKDTVLLKDFLNDENIKLGLKELRPSEPNAAM